MPQGELHHFADLLYSVAETADVVVSDVRAPCVLRFLELGPEFDLRRFRHLDDTAGLGGDHNQADFLETVGRQFRKAPHGSAHSRIARSRTLLDRR